MSDEKKAEDYGEPWMHEPGHTVNVLSREGQDVCYFSDHNAPTKRHFAQAERAVACVNFLAGVPTETIVACTKRGGEVRNEAAAMFLAFLKGDGLAALTYADEVQALAVGGAKFVRRDELVAANGQLGAMVGKLRKELRHAYATLLKYRIQHLGIADLMARISYVLEQTRTGDPG